MANSTDRRRAANIIRMEVAKLEHVIQHCRELLRQNPDERVASVLYDMIADAEATLERLRKPRTKKPEP